MAQQDFNIPTWSIRADLMDSDASESALLTASLVRATPVSVTFMSLMAESLSFVDSTLVPRAFWGQNVNDVRKYLGPWPISQPPFVLSASLLEI